MYPTLHRLNKLLHGMAIDLWRRVTLCKQLVQEAADSVPYATAADATPAVLAPTAAHSAAEGVTPTPPPRHHLP